MHEIITGMIILYLVWDKFISVRFDIYYRHKTLELTYWNTFFPGGIRSGIVFLEIDFNKYLRTNKS